MSCFRCRAALLVLVCAFAAPSHAKDWSELRIASEGARPPYNYVDANGELMGFEIDLGQELCKRMKAACVFIPHDWESLVPALLEGRVDAIMAALEITDARLQTFDFSKPYVKMPNAFALPRDTALLDVKPETLKQKTIGVEADGQHQSFLEARYPQAGIKAYDTLEDAILDLAEARIDAVFGDKDSLADFLKRRDAQCCKIFADVPRDPAFFSEGIGVGLRQADQDLKALFNKALDEAMKDGAFDAIARKYWEFGVR